VCESITFSSFGAIVDRFHCLTLLLLLQLLLLPLLLM